MLEYIPIFALRVVFVWNIGRIFYSVPWSTASLTYKSYNFTRGHDKKKDGEGRKGGPREMEMEAAFIVWRKLLILLKMSSLRFYHRTQSSCNTLIKQEFFLYLRFIHCLRAYILNYHVIVLYHKYDT